MLKKHLGILLKYRINWVISILPLIFLGIILRFVWLGAFPVGMNHDEIDVTLSAKSYWKFKTDYSGVSFPKSLFITKTEANLSGLPSFLLFPILGGFKTTPINVRIPFVIVNLLTIALVLLIAWNSTRNFRLVFILLFVSLINPWVFFYSRAETEAPFSLLFTLAATYILFSSKNRKIYWSIPLFLAAFYSYFGARIVTPVFVFLIFMAYWLVTKQKIRQIILCFVLLFLCFASYFYISDKIPGSTFSVRKNEVSFIDLNKYSSLVNEQRRAAISFKFNSIFYNKPLSLAKYSLSKYLGYISPNYLFFGGDELVPFEEHGMFYLIDAVFMVFGIFSIINFRKGRSKSIILITFALILAAPVGTAISMIGNQNIFRSYLLIPGLIFLVSFGIYYIFDLLKWNKFAIIPISFIYLVSFFNFGSFFFFRYSIKQQENHFLSERILANYLMKTNEQNIVIIDNNPYAIVGEYLFFSSGLDKVKTLPIARQDYYKLGNMIISNDCKYINSGDVFVVRSDVECNISYPKDFITIENQKDSGSIFRIYNDKLCTNIELDPYRSTHFVSDYYIEKMDKDTFCKRWLNRYLQ